MRESRQRVVETLFLRKQNGLVVHGAIQDVENLDHVRPYAIKDKVIPVNPSPDARGFPARHEGKRLGSQPNAIALIL